MNIVRPIFSALIPSHVISQSQQTDCNDVLIKFADGSSALFPWIVLNVLEYFREADGKTAFEVKECDLPAFKVILSLAGGHRLLRDLVEPETLQNPFLYEQLARLLVSFCPKAAKAILEDLKEELSIILIAEAKNIQEKYKPGMAETTPYLVEVADRTLVSSHYFAGEKDASIYFESLTSAHKQYLSLKRKLVRNQSKLPLNDPYIAYLSTQVSFFKNRLETLKDEINPDKMPIRNLKNMIACAEQNDSYKELALLCTEKVDKYKSYTATLNIGHEFAIKERKIKEIQYGSWSSQTLDSITKNRGGASSFKR